MKSIIVKKVVEIVRRDLMVCEGTYGCDLHSRLFNEAPTYIHPDDAIKPLLKIGVFKSISIVQDYEKQIFGNIYTKIEPCAIADALVYIAGYTLLGNSKTLDEKWDTKLTKSDLLKIRKELNTYMRENPNDDLLSDWA